MVHSKIIFDLLQESWKQRHPCSCASAEVRDDNRLPECQQLENEGIVLLEFIS